MAEDEAVTPGAELDPGFGARARAWRTWRREVEGRLRAGAVAAPEAEARWLCEHVSGHAGSEWREVEPTAPTSRQVAQLDALVARRLAGEPLQYVLGGWAFRELDLLVDSRVLIPRPETEWVVDVALREAPSHARVAVDLGTGSGAIALSLAVARPSWRVVATDVSDAALAVARWNGAGNAIANVEFAAGDWWSALVGVTDLEPGSVDLVVSNPPYVAETERPDLAPEVVDHEPALALFGGPNGLDAIRVVLGGVGQWLAPGGVVVVEHGASQGDPVVELATAAGLIGARTVTDLSGRPRCLVAQAPRPGAAER